jgi:hypothetical protein
MFDEVRKERADNGGSRFRQGIMANRHATGAIDAR